MSFKSNLASVYFSLSLIVTKNGKQSENRQCHKIFQSKRNKNTFEIAVLSKGQGGSDGQNRVKWKAFIFKNRQMLSSYEGNKKNHTLFLYPLGTLSHPLVWSWIGIFLLKIFFPEIKGFYYFIFQKQFQFLWMWTYFQKIGIKKWW